VEARSVNVRFKALEKEEPRRVTSRSAGRSHRVSNCIVGDTTAVITLTLWNHDIDEIEVGNSFELVNGYINIYDECMHLARGRWGEFRKVSEDTSEINRDLDMSRPFMGRPKQRRRERSPTGRTFSGTAGRESRGYPSRKSF
jgi:ssDNA-binding replication factor A large subunit